MVRLSACLKAVTALTVEMTHKQPDRLISTESGILILYLYSIEFRHNREILLNNVPSQLEGPLIFLIWVCNVSYAAYHMHRHYQHELDEVSQNDSSEPEVLDRKTFTRKRLFSKTMSDVACHEAFFGNRRFHQHFQVTIQKQQIVEPSTIIVEQFSHCIRTRKDSIFLAHSEQANVTHLSNSTIVKTD